MAWLNATPKPPAGSRRAKSQENAKRISRLAQLRREKITPAMPPNPAPHVIERLTEIGLTQASGMSVGPISWAEIAAWQRNTHVRLPAWEARLIHRLSVEYVAQGHRSEDETCPPPWRAEVTQREIETEQARLRMVLG